MVMDLFHRIFVAQRWKDKGVTLSSFLVFISYISGFFRIRF
jgi:hypothetical protein